MRKIFGFILIVVGIFTVFLAVKGMVSAPESTKVFENAVTVEDGKLDPANEGKMVIVTGTLKSDQQLQDPLTGLELPGIAARRVVWTYEALGPRDKNDYVTWDWVEDVIPIGEAPYYGINADTQITTVLVAPTTIGDFQVDNNYFTEVSLSDTFTDYNENDLKKGWYLHSKDKEAKCSISQDEELSRRTKHYTPETLGEPSKPWDAGRQKISYRIFSPEDPMVYTLVGIQKGDTLIQDANIGLATIYEGALTLDDFMEETEGSVRAGSIFGIVIGLLITLLGVKKLLFRRCQE